MNFTFPWGGVPYPLQEANKHFFVMGATGSGKTVTLRLLMQEVLTLIGAREGENLLDHRAVLYDAKQDLLGYLYGMGLNPERIKVLNPFDERCSTWDMATDVTGPATAQQIAQILIPEDKNATQPFFNNAARHLLSGVLLALIAKKKATGYHWTFRDVVLAMRSENAMRQLFEQEESKEYTGHLVEMYLNPGITLNNIKSTIASKMMAYEVVAAAWSRAAKKRDMVSLRDFLDQKSGKRLIFVLGNDEANREAVDAINRVLFKRLAELVVAQTDSDTRRTWIFLDEVREAGYLNGLQSLLLRGRSKGTCVVLGFQDIDGLHEVYGEYQARELLGQCAYKAILRLESPTTAKWAAEHFGTRERIVTRASENTTFGIEMTRNKGGAEQLENTETLLPIELLRIPSINPREKKLTGFYLTPAEHYPNTIRFGNHENDPLPSEEARYYPLLPNEKALAYKPRDEEDQYLKAWSDDEKKQLGIVQETRKKSNAPSGIPNISDVTIGELAKMFGGSPETPKAASTEEYLDQYTAPDDLEYGSPAYLEWLSKKYQKPVVKIGDIKP